MIFATLTDCENIDDENSILIIELANANINKLNKIMGEIYAEKLSSESKTHKFIFNSYKTDKNIVDLHEYESSKISIGTYTEITDVYIVLDVKKII